MLIVPMCPEVWPNLSTLIMHCKQQTTNNKRNKAFIILYFYLYFHVLFTVLGVIFVLFYFRDIRDIWGLLFVELFINYVWWWFYFFSYFHGFKIFFKMGVVPGVPFVPKNQYLLISLYSPYNVFISPHFLESLEIVICLFGVI